MTILKRLNKIHDKQSDLLVPHPLQKILISFSAGTQWLQSTSTKCIAFIQAGCCNIISLTNDLLPQSITGIWEYHRLQIHSPPSRPPSVICCHSSFVSGSKSCNHSTAPREYHHQKNGSDSRRQFTITFSRKMRMKI